MTTTGARHGFWHPPIWKWGVFVVLVVVLIWLLWWPAPPVKFAVRPFNATPPAWDGSQPWMIASPIPGTKPVRFKVSIELVKPTLRHDTPVNEFIVNLRNGNFKVLQTDLFTPDVMPLCLTRSYYAWNPSSRAFGVGTNHPYDISPTGSRFPYTYMILNLEDGNAVYMPRVSTGTGYADAVFRHEESSSEFFGAQVVWNGNGWTMTFRDGRKIDFPDSYNAKNFAQGAPTEMTDSQGNKIELKRDKSRNLQELISPRGGKITFRYDTADRIIEADDSRGNVRKYSYDKSGHVETVSDGNQVLYRFEYQHLLNDADRDDPYLMTAVMDGDWTVLVRNKFANGRVSEQRLADGEAFVYEYQFKGDEVAQTTVTLPSGETKTFYFRDGIMTGQK